MDLLPTRDFRIIKKDELGVKVDLMSMKYQKKINYDVRLLVFVLCVYSTYILLKWYINFCLLFSSPIYAHFS